MTRKKKEHLRTTGKYTISSADLAKQEEKRKEAESLNPKKKGREAIMFRSMINSTQLEKGEKKKRKR